MSLLEVAAGVAIGFVVGHFAVRVIETGWPLENLRRRLMAWWRKRHPRGG